MLERKRIMQNEEENRGTFGQIRGLEITLWGNRKPCLNWGLSAGCRAGSTSAVWTKALRWKGQGERGGAGDTAVAVGHLWSWEGG
jgi:hypothetical protein